MMAVMNAPAPQTAAAKSGSGGKLVVIGIFVVAVIAASAGLAYKFIASKQPLELWGPEGIQVIQSAPSVELLTLAAGGSPSRELTLQIGDQELQIVEQKDIAKAQGLIHHRHFLTERVSYQSPPAPVTTQRLWTHALRFRQGNSEVLILFDLTDRRLANYQTQREVEVIPEIAENWKRFITRQLAPAKN